MENLESLREIVEEFQISRATLRAFDLDKDFIRQFTQVEFIPDIPTNRMPVIVKSDGTIIEHSQRSFVESKISSEAEPIDMSLVTNESSFISQSEYNIRRNFTKSSILLKTEDSDQGYEVRRNPPSSGFHSLNSEPEIIEIESTDNEHIERNTSSGFDILHSDPIKIEESILVSDASGAQSSQSSILILDSEPVSIEEI